MRRILAAIRLIDREAYRGWSIVLYAAGEALSRGALGRMSNSQVPTAMNPPFYQQSASFGISQTT